MAGRNTVFRQMLKFGGGLSGALFLLMVLFQLGFVNAYPEAPQEILFSTETYDFNPEHLRPLLSAKNELNLERKKIQYLISQVQKSQYTFIWNGRDFPSFLAASHIRTKYRHGFRQIKTARDFIKRIASRSMATGRPYMMKTAKGHKYLTRDVLYNELDRLEHHLSLA